MTDTVNNTEATTPNLNLLQATILILKNYFYAKPELGWNGGYNFKWKHSVNLGLTLFLINGFAWLHVGYVWNKAMLSMGESWLLLCMAPLYIFPIIIALVDHTVSDIKRKAQKLAK